MAASCSLYINQLLHMQNRLYALMMAWLCIHVPVPSLFTHVLRLCGANLQRMPSSSFPSFDINIWTNAVRQLLVENPQQSLAVTTWECSSEGHALHCDYKQHRECRAHDATIVLPRRHFWCFCYPTNIQGFFFFSEQLWGFMLWLVEASAVPFWSWSHKTVAVLCHSHSIIAVNISEGWRYQTDLMKAVKTVITGTVKEESNVVILQMPQKHTRGTPQNEYLSF